MDKVTGASLQTAGSAGGKTGAAGTDAAVARDKKLRKACADFEAVMTYQMLKTMRRTAPSLTSITKYPGKETYDMMMDQKVAEELSRRGKGLGIQDLLYRQLKGKVAP
ncbi:MAG: hypothetical protein HPY65_09730 [Syntrophaceae bacterium]|nr:hypothetical protein [Syntrophaceae bacterium]